MGALLSLGYIALLLFWIRRSHFFTLPGLRKRHLAGFFLLKVLAGTALWWIYTYHFTDRSTADIYKYFDASKPMVDALWTRPLDFLQMLFGINNDTPYFNQTYYLHIDHWYRKYESNLYNDSHTMIRFNAFVRIFSGGHFHVHTVFAAFLSFAGLTAIGKAFAPYLRGRERALYLSLFVLPSVLFWASGVIKESLLFFGLGLMLWKVFRWIEGRFSISDLVVLGFCLLLLFFLKFYVLMSMFPALVALAWCGRTDRRAWVKYAVAISLIIAAALNIHHLIKGFEILQVLWWKHKDFIGLAALMNSGSFVQPPALEPTFWSFLVNAPYAIYITLFGPLVHAGGGALGLVAAAENLLLVAVFVVVAFHLRKRAEIDLRLFLFCVTFVVLLSLVIGYTTPVMGAIVRYRTPLLPFLMIAGLLVLDERKLLARWKWMRPLFP